MVEVSIAAEGLFGLTWPQWKRLVNRVEDLGFAGLYISDHFFVPDPPDHPSLEMTTALTYLADHTERVRFGPRVSPISFRDPVMLARQAAALDELSGGRMVLGLGTGWMEREHTMFGYDLGDMPTRFARLEEGLEVITRLLRSDEPVSFEGRFFRLHEAVLPPPKRAGGPPVMIGGVGPKRTLPLVARFADAWNAGNLSPDQLRERSMMLDGLIEEAGRRPEDVRRTLNTPVVCWRTPTELEARLRTVRRLFSSWRSLSDDQLVEMFRGSSWIVGSPEEVIDQIRAFEAVGIVEIELKWTNPDDLEGLEMLVTEVLPHVSGVTA